VLTRALVSVLAAGLAAVLMLAAGQQAALAGVQEDWYAGRRRAPE
jgi:hypothetical protein